MDKKERLELDSMCYNIAISVIAVFIMIGLALNDVPYELIAIDFGLLGFRFFMTFRKTKEMHSILAVIGCAIVVVFFLILFASQYVNH